MKHWFFILIVLGSPTPCLAQPHYVGTREGYCAVLSGIDHRAQCSRRGVSSTEARRLVTDALVRRVLPLALEAHGYEAESSRLRALVPLASDDAIEAAGSAVDRMSLEIARLEGTDTPLVRAVLRTRGVLVRMRSTRYGRSAVVIAAVVGPGSILDDFEEAMRSSATAVGKVGRLWHAFSGEIRALSRRL